ncbi:hypothetical protein [Psychrobacter lutiphocae]|uniref:hypothetical protein n=1 Tax=Psychrobacter lutiphocae TaxID=540500 RepID=UPI0003828EA2|nr:hypothetical protein [Psychrobacter lutiphocae]
MTKATVGEGAIVTSDAITGKDSLAGVNRDAFNTEIIIKDQQTAGLDVDANIDARVFTKAGRDEIIDEQKDIGKNAKKIGAITVSDALKAPAIIAAITDNGNKNPDSQNKSTLDKAKDNITQIGNNNRTGMSDDTATLVATEELIVTGDITNDVVAQDTYKQLASEIASGTDAQNANVYVTPDLTESRGGELGTIVLGSANETTQLDIYLDRGALDRSDGVTVANGQVEPILNAPRTINVLNEEIAHSNGMGEASASTMGNLGEIAYDVGKWANSDDIAEAKESIDTTAINNANTAQEQQEMLAANKERLESQQEAGDAFENKLNTGGSGAGSSWGNSEKVEQQERMDRTMLALNRNMMFDWKKSEHRPSMHYMNGSFLPSGATVRFGVNYTSIGDDIRTINITNNSRLEPQMHNVIVHGELENRDKNTTNNMYVNDLPTHTQQIADAILSNPSYKGEIINLISCHSACNGTAQELSNITGSIVRAPTDRIGIPRGSKPGTPLVIDRNGEYRYFTPEK